MNYNKLKFTIKSKKLTQEDLANDLLMTPQGVQQMLSRQSISVKQLE
jgi:transcriptional regulator with XRE-family HTH domain